MKKIIYITMVVLLVLLAACSKDKEKVEEKNIGEKAEETNEKENLYPLTGIETNEDVNNRIVGVMVNNHHQARPQSGLSQADIVFEILSEGNITRLLALFQSEKPDVVGPVRSAREYYFDLASKYNALYVYHGAAEFVNEMIRDRGIDHLNGSYYDNDGNLFKRESFRKAPHNSYLQFGAVDDVAKEKGYDMEATYDPLPFLSEEEIGALSGEPAKQVEIVYFKNPSTIVEYEYNDKTEKYVRFNDGEKTVELNSDDPIQVDNVFIVETSHKVIDDAGRREVDMESGGNAYLLQKGKVQKLHWENKDGRIIPVKEGNTIGFVPGKTWINVVPSNPGMEQSVMITNE